MASTYGSQDRENKNDPIRYVNFWSSKTQGCASIPVQGSIVRTGDGRVEEV